MSVCVYGIAADDLPPDFRPGGSTMIWPLVPLPLPKGACAALHPTVAVFCSLPRGHDDVACSWERYDESGEVVESYEWLQR